ncbi:MAG TPA: aldolase/citrate lyase family protein [Steroidobacteraceae bacterium]|jgi:4-hydroxy-2-oxoheptanedioate aldolase
MKIHRDLKAKLQSGGVVVGTWMSIPHIMAAETLAQGGFDFLLLDGEHAPVSVDVVGSLLTATDLFGTPVIYRVRSNSDDLIKAALDAGAAGIMVPMVNSVADAERAVGAAKYPPRGHRGIGPWRVSNYYADYLNCVAESNSATSVVLQIESPAAVEAISDIAAVQSVDVLYVGPADLAASMGLPIGQLHPKLMDALSKVATAVRKQNKIAAIDVVSIEYARRFVELGFSFFTYGIDTSYLMDGARAASDQFRQNVSSRRGE